MTDKNGTLTNSNTWIRLAYMVLFTLLLMAARLVISLVVFVQFLLVLVTGSDNQNLRDLGQGLGKWVYQTIMFLTFNSESKPFPFDEWPVVDPSEGYSVRTPEVVEDGEFVEVEDDDVPSFTSSDEAADQDSQDVEDKKPADVKKSPKKQAKASKDSVKPVADKKPSAGKEPLADKKPSAVKKPAADK